MTRKTDLSRFKSDINLTSYAAHLGYEVDRKKSTRASIVMRRGTDKIVISRRGGLWVYFSVSDDADHGTIIDFALKRTGQGMGDIIHDLRSWNSGLPPPEYLPDCAEQQADPARVRAIFRHCRAVRTHAYLESRNIYRNVLTDSRFYGRIFSDRYDNAVFPHYGAGGLCALELKNAEKAIFVRGSVKTFWRSQIRAEDQKLVLSEAVIDALSYHHLYPDPNAFYTATGGGFSAEQGRVIGTLAAEKAGLRQIVLVTDNDEGGDKIAARIESAIRAGKESTGKADHNIAMMAQRLGGIYDEQAHREAITKEQGYIPEEAREGYLNSHIRRLETFEKNGIVKNLGGGRFEVPEDVVVRGAEVTRQMNERERKRFYPMLDVLSAEPPEKQKDLSKKTWLDRQLYRIGKGERELYSFDSKTREALMQRQGWLVEKDIGVIQSSGKFALRDDALRRLDRLEVYEAGRVLAEKAGLEFDRSRVREGSAYRYLGYVRLESGIWAVASQGKGLYMAPVDKEPDEVKREDAVTFTRRADRKYEVRSLERKQQRGRDDDWDREL